MTGRLTLNRDLRFPAALNFGFNQSLSLYLNTFTLYTCI